MKRTFFAFLASLALVAQMLAQAPIKISSLERKIADGVTADQLHQYLNFVASDEMEGRDTPSRGLNTVAKFIALNLTKWGFKPAGDDGTFFQHIALHRDTIDPSVSFAEFNNQHYAYGDDVIRASGPQSGSVNGMIVYAGNGWMIKSKNLNPYAGLDVKGKYIAVYGEGQGGFGTVVPIPEGVTAADVPRTTRGTDWADVTTYAAANGAAGVIVLPSKAISQNWGQLQRNSFGGRFSVDKFAAPAGAGRQGAAPPVPVVYISPKLAQAIFTGEQQNPMSGSAAPFALNGGRSFTFTVGTKREDSSTQNVVAIWEGSDPKLKDEMVAIGAHYDHIGNAAVPGSQCRAIPGDMICNGADDDGSGTVSILSIAEALSKAPQRPRRSAIFVWHCGEEKGLWGSQYFNQYPPAAVNIKNVIAQLNIDMIGRSKKPGYMAPCDTNPAPGRAPCNSTLTDENTIYVIGKDMMSSVLSNIVGGVNAGYLKLGYDTRYDDPKDPNRFFYRSDHFNYAKNGIPITFWFDGEHEDYHQPGDEPQKIDYNKMQNVARTIMITLWELTDLKERPKVDKELPEQLKAAQNGR
ncbi:MAG TPA: M28 family peptidase [Pyrinomonadaceae bacterium]